MRYRVYVDEGKRRKDGMMPVALIFEDMGRRFKVMTGLYAEKKFSGREFAEDEPNRMAKTAALTRKLLRVDEHLLMAEGEPLAELKAFVKELMGGVDRNAMPLYRALERFAGARRTENTRLLYMRTAAKVEAFDGGVSVKGVTTAWLEKFERWLEAGGCVSANSRAVHLRNLKAVMNWAYDEGMTAELPFRRFKIRMERVVINNIPTETLRKLRDCPVLPGKELYRDLFMLSFYLAGINPVDMLHLTRANWKNGHITYRRHKTGKLISVPVTAAAERLLEKYRGERYLLRMMDVERDYLKFTSKWDKHLKTLGPEMVVPDTIGRMRRRMGEPVVPEATVYSARYSFASVGAEIGVPREAVALCLGHSWADVTSRYMAYGQKTVDDAVRRIVDYVESE